ncbi:uncharacterized protein LOC125699112 [Lagopus muta]|uniref:uncharacterized protein LOC125699112 n=1 Tax=Lagopus muta TaxID=64668 RepID=UPI0020A132E8|nr:uncharacterized protein LOC125699112 [Lagopus muta]XP_048814252.1 uncharacterized protein LOC125699112 [Lagopus muta]XP_048814253.1 uncharacterized protein LOC125699112 [Lagopus muta]XP_048814254.1 uncharacterized protein LOC125699112 [Lagopus muta]XP_048814255.1 uncharacterized protein LOC125699112 [Lagopus muta]
MSILVVKGILPLLLLAWPPAGLADQCSQTTSVSLGSDLTFHCLPNSLDREVVWCDTLSKKKKAEKDTGSALHKENVSSNFTFTSVNEKHAGNYTCKMKTCPIAENKNRPCKNHKAKDTCGKRNPLCWFMLWTENKTMHVKWWTCPEPPDNCLEHSKAHHSDSHGSMDAASAEPMVCTVSSRSFTGTENATQGMAPSSDPKTSPTREPQIQEGLIAIIYLYAIPGLVVVTLFLLLCILVCLCRRKQKDAKGTPESKHAAEMNQLSTPPPAPQTEDLTYAKLIFERTGAIPAASEVVYTEIKPLQKK